MTGAGPRVLFEMAGQGSPAPALTEPEWRELLALADRTQLTLHLRGTPGLPSWLLEEIETRSLKNAARRRRLRDAYQEVADALAAAEIEFVMLKGFTHETGFGEHASARVQYDLDLLTQPHDVPRARRVCERLGYAPHGKQSLSEEHSRPLVRPSEWRWRGDYYDPEMPIPVELHGSAWSAEHDRIRPRGMEEFWNRRCVIEVNGLRVPAFCEVDRLAFAALHVLRHILRHDARPAHVLELARFLEGRNGDATFWDKWRTLHPPELRALQTVAFRFAREWFGCALPEAAGQSSTKLQEVTYSQISKALAHARGSEGVPEPRSQGSGIREPAQLGTEPVEGWFRQFAWSPVANLIEPNKDTVWLHLALVESWRDRVHVFCHRMLPVRLPHEKLWDRLRYHAGALVPALASGARWWLRRRQAASTAPAISD